MSCLICNAPCPNYPGDEYCCSGHDCGCYGQPIYPEICSDKCNEALYLSGTYEERRIKSGIELHSNGLLKETGAISE